jgi:hypothetical protein
MCNICKKGLECIGARRKNLSRLRVEKLGCASSPAGLVTLGLFVHPSNQSGAGASARLVATEATHSSCLCVTPPGSWAVSSLYFGRTSAKLFQFSTPIREEGQPGTDLHFAWCSRRMHRAPPANFFSQLLHTMALQFPLLAGALTATLPHTAAVRGGLVLFRRHAYRQPTASRL